MGLEMILKKSRLLLSTLSFFYTHFNALPFSSLSTKSLLKHVNAAPRDQPTQVLSDDQNAVLSTL